MRRLLSACCTNLPIPSRRPILSFGKVHCITQKHQSQVSVRWLLGTRGSRRRQNPCRSVVARKPTSCLCSTHYLTRHKDNRREFDECIFSLAEVTNLPVFLVSGRTFVVSPSLCQSLLVDLLTAGNFSFPPCHLFHCTSARSTPLEFGHSIW